MDSWICIMISTGYQHGDRDAATAAIKRFFESDLKEVTFVCDDAMWKSGEYYCFVRCSKYEDHINILRENTMMFQVVPNCDKPDRMTTEDVDKFVASVRDANKRKEYTKGDIVSVSEGYLKNLHGLVVGKHNNSKYKVSFHFCTRKFVENLPEGYLRFMGNIFNRRYAVTSESIKKGRIPSRKADPELQEAIAKIVNKHKVHRKKNRNCSKTG